LIAERRDLHVRVSRESPHHAPPLPAEANDANADAVVGAQDFIACRSHCDASGDTLFDETPSFYAIVHSPPIRCDPVFSFQFSAIERDLPTEN
jgi:hypothetical protein